MTLQVQVVSPEREIWSGKAQMVSARTLEGEIGVLTGHAPTLAVLADGEVRVQAEGGQDLVAQVSGGFLSIDHDTVLVVAEHVESSDTGNTTGTRGGPGERPSERERP